MRFHIALRRLTLLPLLLWLLSAASALVAEEPLVESPLTASDRAHWSFSPVAPQPQPRVRNRDWLQTHVDAFILAGLEEQGLAPAGEAARATLLRRLSFDLTGLPPTPGELSAFEADSSPDAYERQLDRLLASPAYGERWGQHWLDLARFAETDGFEHDKIRDEAWRYRDWVVAALNADLPYDEFVRLQLAGDEVQAPETKVQDPMSRIEGRTSAASSPSHQPPAPSPSSIATMFALAGPDMPDINDQDERRHSRLNELTATVGAVFLGLQMGCAQCHDHKYDPITQGDFYRLRAVFEPAVPPLKRDAPYLTLAHHADVPAPRLWLRGDHRRPGPEVSPAFPRIADTPAASSERAERGHLRTELARWLTRDDNPLAGRVIANRLWLYHFGRGICDTPSDLGLMSANPTHPELLDWLAIELRDSGWSWKHLHRVIAGSATYRQASVLDSTASSANPKSQIENPKSVDPENLLYWHFPRRRLEGEAVRDAILSAAGLLNSMAGGPGVMPPIAPELERTLLKGQWIESPDEGDHYRRSIYVFARRNLRYPIFEAFDRPDANASCPSRNRSTTAPQSLLLLNSEFSLLAARYLAGRIASDTSAPAEQIERLYALALSRRPTASETALLVSFLDQQCKRLEAEARPADELALPVPLRDGHAPYAAAALVDACLAVLNSNELLYVD